MINVDSAVASPRLLRQLTAELRGQPRSLIETLLGAVRPDQRRGERLDVGLWGRAPTAHEVRWAAADNLAYGISRRRAVLESSLTRAEVARQLGKTPQAVSAMLERGALLGLKEGREWRIPAWQMEPGLPDGVLPGLGLLARTYRDGVVSLTEWVQLPHPDLDDATPREALGSGEVVAVTAAARTGE